jgi:FMN reductase
MQPTIIGIGGSTRVGSTAERALQIALQIAEEANMRTVLFSGAFLAELPIFSPENEARTQAQRELVEAVRGADGLILATPGYHGGMSGLVKNAMDLLEDLRDDRRPYLDGRPVGCIVTASGPQALGTTLQGMRSVIHALRGWPTPLGAGLNITERIFDATGRCTHEAAAAQIAGVARQVVEFTSRWRASS